MTEYRAGSLSDRRSPLPPLSGSPTDNQYDEIIQSGYLNRKCIQEVGKKSKDRSWSTLWCIIKGSLMEFSRVDGVSPRSQGAPPPKDMFPPTNQKYVGCVELEDSLVDIDYTSQMNKDINKRRSFLFTLGLANSSEYIFQAPSEKNRTAWVMAIKNVSRRVPADEIEGGGVHSLAHAIKTSRDSIKLKSRQNVHSIKKQHTSVPVNIRGTIGSIEESELLEVPVAQSLVGGDPQLRLLKKRLQEKRELLKQLKTMYTSFMGGSGALYADALIHHEKPSPSHTPQGFNKELGVVHRCMTLPEAKGQDEGEDKRSSTGEYSVPVTPLSPGVQTMKEVIETELLVDYYLVPGAHWSLVRKGETVRVLGRASNGWYQCMALQGTTVNMEFDATAGYPYSGISSGLSDPSINSIDTNSSLDTMESEITQNSPGSEVSGSEFNHNSSPSEVNGSGISTESTFSEPEPELPKVVGQTNSKISSDLISDPEDDPAVAKASMNLGRTQSYMIATSDLPVTAKTNVTRAPSYIKAAESINNDKFEDVLLAHYGQGRKKVGRSTSAITPSTHSNVHYRRLVEKRRSETASLYVPTSKPISIRLMALIEREKKTGKYVSPLLGCVAPSALKYFAENPDDMSQLEVELTQDEVTVHSRQLSTVSTHSNEIPELQSLIPRSLESLKPEIDRPQSADLILESTEHLLVPESVRPKSAEPELETVGKVIPPVQQGGSIALQSPPSGKLRHSIQFSDNLSNIEKSGAFKDEFLLMDYEEEPTNPISPGTLDHSSRSKSLPPPMMDSTPVFSPLRTRPNGMEDVGGWSEPKPVMMRRSNRASTIDPKQSLFKKLFGGKKTKARSASNPAHVTISPLHSSQGRRQRPHTLAREKPLAIQNITAGDRMEFDDEFFTNTERLRVASLSGRPVKLEGVSLVIGDESSSESEDENGDNDMLFKDNPRACVTPPIRDEGVLHLRTVSDISDVSDLSDRRLKRSASDHSSPTHNATLESAQVAAAEEGNQRKASTLTKNIVSPFRKAKSGLDDSPSNSLVRTKSKKQKKRSGTLSGPEIYKLNSPSTPVGTPGINTNWDVIFRAPPRGEKRYVYLDPEDAGGKYGFRLQSYGRVREQGKVLQTFVQSVVPGSVSFLAGLYPGDAIIEVNGVNVKYAPVEDVVRGIQEGAKKMERIALRVEFVDGVTRLERMKHSDDVKASIKDKQLQLKRLIDQSSTGSTPTTPLHSPHTITHVTSLTPWSETTPTILEPKQPTFSYDRFLNNIVSLHKESVIGLQCDVLVMPLSSCHQPSSGTENVLLQLLKTGGEGLLNELSLAKQCRLGENIITGGHDLGAHSIYHCVFGTLEESLQKCCVQALIDASSRGHRSIVFWLDGFASIAVSPQIIIESVRQWLGGNNSVLFDRVVFSAKANLNIIENFLEAAFPLQPNAQRDSIISEQSSTADLELGIEVSDNRNEIQKEISPDKERGKEIENHKDHQNESLPLSENVPEKPPLFQPTGEDAVSEDDDTVADLPDITVDPKESRPDKTSISDIGIQLEISSDEGTEDENQFPVLKLSESDSDHSDNSLPSVLSDFKDQSSISFVSQQPVLGRSLTRTPPTQRSYFSTAISHSTPTRGLVVVMGGKSPSPSPTGSPRTVKNTSTLVLNPERMESDV